MGARGFLRFLRMTEPGATDYVQIAKDYVHKSINVRNPGKKTEPGTTDYVQIEKDYVHKRINVRNPWKKDEVGGVDYVQIAKDYVLKVQAYVIGSEKFKSAAPITYKSQKITY